MATDLFKVGTGSTGPGGETIFDVFSGAEHIKDPSDPRLAGVNISSLPTGTAPTGFQSQFLPAQDGTGTTPTGLLSLPSLDQFNINDIMGAIESPVSAEDTRKLMANLQEQQVKIAELLKPTSREQELMGQISGVQGAAEGGVGQLAGRAGIDLFTLGRGVSQIERDAATLLAPLQRQLGLEQGKRGAELQAQQVLSDSTKNALNFAQQQSQQALQKFQVISTYMNQLTDNARQAFQTIITNFGGLAFEDLDQNTQLQVRQLARNIGIPEGILREGMQTIKEQQLAQSAVKQADLQAQREIQNSISLMRLELAMSKAGVKDEGEIENLSLYTDSLQAALDGGASPSQAVFAASAIANNLGTKLSKSQQNTLLDIANQYKALVGTSGGIELGGGTTAPSQPTSKIEQVISELKSGTTELRDKDIRLALIRRGFTQDEINKSSVSSFQGQATSAVGSFFSKLFNF